MEFDLEKARELFETGQFASIAHGIGSTSSHVRQIPACCSEPPSARLVYTGRLAFASQFANSIDNVIRHYQRKPKLR